MGRNTGGAVRLLGLDRVAGAMVRTRESARQQAKAALDSSSSKSTAGATMTAADSEYGGLRLGGAGGGQAPGLLAAVDGEVPVESEDTVGDDVGFVQVCGGVANRFAVVDNVVIFVRQCVFRYQ